MTLNLGQILQLILPGLATGFGAIPIFFIKNTSKKLLNLLLAVAAGIMLCATFFALILPSLEYGGEGVGAVFTTSVGILAGVVMIDLIDRFIPHEHLISHEVEGGNAENLKKIWLFVIAISIHNFPEGLATGVATAPVDNSGFSIALAIALQNMPEGLSVAISLRQENYSKMKSFLVALLTGLIEPVGAFIGYFLGSISYVILPFILAFAGGAMLFVIEDEIIPQIHQDGGSRLASYGVISGFILMMALDILL